MSYFFFFHESPSSSLSTVLGSILLDIDEVLSINISANLFVFGDFNIHHKDWLTYSGRADRADRTLIFLSQIDLLRWLTFLLGSLSHSPAILDLFVSSDSSICSIMAFPALRHFDYVVVWSNSKWGAPFHRIACNYSCADWDGFCDHSRDFPCGDIFKLSISAASEFSQWVQVEISVYIPHCKYHVKHHHMVFSCLCCCHSS